MNYQQRESQYRKKAKVRKAKEKTSLRKIRRIERARQPKRTEEKSATKPVDPTLKREKTVLAQQRSERRLQLQAQREEEARQAEEAVRLQKKAEEEAERLAREEEESARRRQREIQAELTRKRLRTIQASRLATVLKGVKDGLVITIKEEGDHQTVTVVDPTMGKKTLAWRKFEERIHEASRRFQSGSEFQIEVKVLIGKK